VESAACAFGLERKPIRVIVPWPSAEGHGGRSLGSCERKANIVHPTHPSTPRPVRCRRDPVWHRVLPTDAGPCRDCARGGLRLTTLDDTDLAKVFGIVASLQYCYEMGSAAQAIERCPKREGAWVPWGGKC
jgi:hypothetical protein